MSVKYPLAIVDAASITSLVRMTLYHHSISVCHTKIDAECKNGVLTVTLPKTEKAKTAKIRIKG
jgi:Hsp20/alpha crystallin family protein